MEDYKGDKEKLIMDIKEPSGKFGGKKLIISKAGFQDLSMYNDYNREDVIEALELALVDERTSLEEEAHEYRSLDRRKLKRLKPFDLKATCTLSESQAKELKHGIDQFIRTEPEESNSEKLYFMKDFEWVDKEELGEQ